MLITVLVVMSLSITTTTVSGNDCECEYNLARNDFHGDQKCFTAYYQIERGWLKYLYSIDGTTTYRDTLCTGNCGTALNRLVYYIDGVFTSTGEVSAALLTIYLCNSHSFLTCRITLHYSLYIS